MRPECARAAAGYSLALTNRPFAGRIGDRLGRGTGSSIEFMDFRDYQVGDDLRHVDWRSYARTDQVKVRLFREEVAPVIDVVVDGSSSMATTEIKAQAVRDLVDAVREWTVRRNGGRVRVHVAGRGPLGPDAALDFESAQQPLRAVTPLWPRGLRMLISDFLFPADPTPDIRLLSQGGSHLYVLQVLDPWELAPGADGDRTLIDCESEARLDLVLDARAIDRYRARLERLRATVVDATRSVGGSFANVCAADPDTMFRSDLLPQGIVEVA